MKEKFVLFVLLILQSIKMVSQVIIADHTVVDKYNYIPQYYLDSVKKTWVSIAGESHSEAYRVGCELLEALDDRFQVNVTESGTPEPFTSSHLRISRATWGDYSYSSGWQYSYGEEDWFTNSTAINRTKAGLLFCKNNGPSLTALGFGWCYDGTYPRVSGSYDPVYHTRWGGESFGSPSGSICWGLDAGDQILTGNIVSMDTYLNVTDEYISYCFANNITTKIFFTTGPIDDDFYAGLNEGELGYQQYLKWNHIRNYINALGTGYLFDYADILCYNNAGVQQATQWIDQNNELQTFPIIHDDNYGGNYVGHIGEVGALRLGKALWWLLARMAGWDGTIQVTEIIVKGDGGASTIAHDDGTLQLFTEVYPSIASNQSVTWSVENGTGQATINSTGLVTAISGGTVTAKATSTDGSGVFGTLNITISSFLWQGTYGSNFGNPDNWLNGVVPPDGSNISFAIIPDNNCILDKNRTLRNINNSQAAKKLVLNGNQLTVTGNLNFSGGAQIDATIAGSVINFSGINVQSIPSGIFQNNVLPSLIINNSNGLTILGELTVTHDLTISSGSILSLVSPTNLTVNGILTNNAGASGLVLKSEPSSNSTLINNTPFVSGTVELDLSGGLGSAGARFHYFVPPCNSIYIGTDTLSVRTNLGLSNFKGDLLAYNEPAAISSLEDGWKYFDGFAYGASPSNPFSALESSKGYSIYLPTNDKIKFKGQLNAQTQSFNLNYTPGNRNPGWNLIGNPYPCNYDLNGIFELSLIQNDGIDNTIYLTKDGGYVYWNVCTKVGIGWDSDIIPPLQGFFIHVTESGKSLNLPVSSKTLSASPPRAKSIAFRENKKLSKIRLVLNNGFIKDETLICMIDEATDGFDNDFDSYKLHVDDYTLPYIFSEIGDTQIAINSIPKPVSSPTIIPVTLMLNAPGNYKIEVAEFDNLEEYKIVLKHNGTETTLYKNAFIVFSSETGTIRNFQVAISNLSNEIEKNRTSKFKIWYSNSFLFIKWPDDIPPIPGRLVIHDFNGRVKYFGEIQLNVDMTSVLPLNLQKGLYMARIIINNSQFVSKIVVF